MLSVTKELLTFLKRVNREIEKLDISEESCLLNGDLSNQS